MRPLPALALALFATVVQDATAWADSTDTPHDFIAEAQLLYRIVACAPGDGSPLPPELDSKVIEAHCRRILPEIDRYRASWVAQAKPFIEKLRPADLPPRVVYPFGGGDLISALTTYPDADEITTLSLEHAGDPRRVHKLTKASLERSLKVIRETIHGLLAFDDSKSVNLMRGQRGELPGQLSFFLVALFVHGYKPVSLKYFTVSKDGELQYLSDDAIARLEATKAKQLRKNWTPPDFSLAFSNAELAFAPIGDDDATKGSRPRVHRHIAANLANDPFALGSPLLLHLEKKGKVAAMTKAASYLLWRNEFSNIRDYLLGHMTFMVSDSTGIPTHFATPAGFTQETYGHYSESFLQANAEFNREFVELWQKQPERPLPFRYGYVDGARRGHMLVTRATRP